MKKIAAMTAIIALVSMPVLAAGQGGFTGPSTTTTTQAGGFTGPSGAVTTVANAKSLRDDTWVTLRGKIVERISDDLYKFQGCFRGDQCRYRPQALERRDRRPAGHSRNSGGSR